MDAQSRDVTIREAGPGDEAAIVRLVREMAADDDDVSPIDEHYVRHFLASPVSGALLARDGGEAVGLLSYCMTPGLFHAADSGLIELLIVTASHRGEGIGRRLVDDGAAPVPGGRLRRGVGEHRRGQRPGPARVPGGRAHRVVAAAREALRELTGGRRDAAPGHRRGPLVPRGRCCAEAASWEREPAERALRRSCRPPRRSRRIADYIAGLGQARRRRRGREEPAHPSEPAGAAGSPQSTRGYGPFASEDVPGLCIGRRPGAPGARQSAGAS